MSTEQNNNKNLLYIAAATTAAAMLCVLLNVGGVLNGLDLINALFRTLGSDTIKYMGASDIFVMFLLLASHLLATIFGLIGTISFLKGNKPKISCIMIIVAGAMGVLSGIITGWNVTAETIALICGIIAIVLNSKLAGESKEAQQA